MFEGSREDTGESFETDAKLTRAKRKYGLNERLWGLQDWALLCTQHTGKDNQRRDVVIPTWSVYGGFE